MASPANRSTIGDDTLAQAIDLHPEHLSLYALTLEENTPMAARVARHELSLPDDDSAAEYVRAGRVDARRGRLRALRDLQLGQRRERPALVHNSLYWQRRPYFGFGAGAHSFDGPTRYSNVLHPRDYIARVQAGASPEADSEAMSTHAIMAETMYLGLRLLQEGVSAEEFPEQTGSRSIFSRQIAELVGWGCWTSSAAVCA